MAYGHTTNLLVPTKLVAPKRRTSWIYRERLISQLTAQAQARLISVVAPAGFGKSTLIAQWLGVDTSDHGQTQLHRSPVAWLSLDEHDQDALRFLAYLAGAITQTYPDRLTFTTQLVSTGAPVGAVLQALLAELSSLPEGMRIVLDDYHAISEPGIHRTVAHLLRLLPPNCQLVLLSRVEPPLPLVRLRAEGQLFELGVAELRFTMTETADLLSTLTGHHPSQAQVATLSQQTDGWALAIQLAVLAGHTFTQNDLSLGQTRRQITEYLANEVFDRQPATIQMALLALAIPERFCPALAAVLLDETGDLLRAESLLDQLVRANLFLIPLDTYGQWFRFHHLFRDFLLRRLTQAIDPQRLKIMQRRAATWLITAQQYEDAVRLFLAAGEHETAIELVETHLREEFKRDVSTTPPRYWLSLLPVELINRRPGLTLLAARLNIFNVDVADLAQRLEWVDLLLADPQIASQALPWPNFQADLTALQGILAYWQGQPTTTLRLIETALKLGPTAPLPVQCLLLYCASIVTSGQFTRALTWLKTELPAYAPLLGPAYAPFEAMACAIIHQITGDLQAQTRAAEKLAALVATGAHSELWEGYAQINLGLVAYERNELATAETHFTALLPLKYRASHLSYMSGVIGLARLALVRNDQSGAEAYAAEAMAFAEEIGGLFLRHQALGCAVQVALATGNREAARETAHAIHSDIHLGHYQTVETPRFSQIQALIACGTPTDLQRADHLLVSCMKEVRTLHHVRLQIYALVLQAQLRRAQGRSAEAWLALDQAVALAAPRGFIRVFLEIGSALPGLVAASTNPLTQHFLQPLIGTPNGRCSKLILLTPREHEILNLLAQRWSDKEIAERLVIAPNTVRKHTGTIYQKLGVSSRREAVAAARANGLLPDPDAIAVG